MQPLRELSQLRAMWNHMGVQEIPIHKYGNQFSALAHNYSCNIKARIQKCNV
jgi:hypothetical protein